MIMILPLDPLPREQNATTINRMLFAPPVIVRRGPAHAATLTRAAQAGWPSVRRAPERGEPRTGADRLPSHIAGAASWRDAVAGATDAELSFLADQLRALQVQRATDRASFAPRPFSYREDLPASPAEFATATRAYRCALRHGLKLSAGAFTLQWFDRDWPEDEAGWAVDERPVRRILIARGQSEVETFRVMCHELQHVADMVRGRWAGMERAEQERRAAEFATRCTVAEYGLSL